MNPPSHAHQALELAQQRVARHDTAMAVDHAHTAWQAADEAGDVACRAQASTLLVQQLFALGRFTEALHQGERALQDWRQLQRHDDECEVLVMMALCLAEADAHDVAIALARTAHDLVQAHDLDARMPRVLALLGGLHGALQEWADGESLLLRALSLARDRHDTATVVVALNGLLMHLVHAHEAQQAAGQIRQAEATAQRLLQHARQSLSLGAEEPQAFRRTVLRSNAAAALLACGHTDEALALLKGVVEQAEADGFRVAALRARCRLAHAHLAQDDQAAAQRQAAALSAQLDAEDHPLARLELLRLQACLARARGDLASAQRLQDQHLALNQPRDAAEGNIRQALAGFNPRL